MAVQSGGAEIRSQQGHYKLCVPHMPLTPARNVVETRDSWELPAWAEPWAPGSGNNLGSKVKSIHTDTERHAHTLIKINRTV